MLDNLRDECLVPSPDLARYAFKQIHKSTQHPVLPENTDAVAEGFKIRFDHTERSMDGPEDEEYDEKVMSIPESLKVGPSRFLHGREHHRHKRNQHNVSAPPGPRQEISSNEAFEANSVHGGEFGQIVPVCDGVDPGEKDNGPADEFVEGDVLIEGDDAI